MDVKIGFSLENENGYLPPTTKRSLLQVLSLSSAASSFAEKVLVFSLRKRVDENERLR